MKPVHPATLPKGACCVVTEPYELTQVVLSGELEAMMNDPEFPALVLITGPVGTGKTYAVTSWCKSVVDRAKTIFAKCDPSAKGYEIIRVLLRQAKLSDQGTGAQLMDRLIEWLRNRVVIVVLDDANVLTSQSLRHLRRLIDEDDMKFVLVMIGTDFSLAKQVAPEIPSRRTGAVSFGPLKGAGLVKALKAYHELLRNTDAELLKRIDKQHCHGEWRAWRSILKKLIAGAAAAGEHSVTEEIASAAVTLRGEIDPWPLSA
jgi:Cdc6-like AAA superfamily ATPase